jgi:DNA mismatch repair protein MutS
MSPTLKNEYFDLFKKHVEEYGEQTIVLMHCGNFFEVYGIKDKDNNIYGSNIVEYCRISDLAIGSTKVMIDDNQVVMAGFTTNLIDRYLKKLLDYNYTVVIYIEEKINGKITRKLDNIFSPGTFFGNNNVITNNTCCFWIEFQKNTWKNTSSMVHVGMSVIDVYTGKTSIMEFTEQYLKNPTTFDELERFVSTHNPSECIIVHNMSPSEINDVICYANIQSKSIHLVCLNQPETIKNVHRALQCEKQAYQNNLLSRFYPYLTVNVFMEMYADKVWATQSFCYLLDFIYQHNPNMVNKISEPMIEMTSNRLTLANHSLKQLNIIDDDNHSGKYSSVSKMLNECITSMGKRQFHHNFLNPVTDEKYLQKEYDMTDSLIKNQNFPDNYKFIKSNLSNMKDISKINRQIMIHNVSPKMLYHMHNTLLEAGQLFLKIQDSSEFMSYIKENLQHHVQIPVFIHQIVSYLDSILHMDICKDLDSVSKFEIIKKGIDPNLDEECKTLMESHDQLQCCIYYFDNIISSSGNEKKKSSKTKNAKNGKKAKKYDEFVCDTDDEDDHEEENEDDDDDDNNDNVRPQKSKCISKHVTEKGNITICATPKRCQIISDFLANSKSKTVTLKYNSTYHKDERQFQLDITGIQFTKQTSAKKSISNNQIDKLCKNITCINDNLKEIVTRIYYHDIIPHMETYQEKINSICEFITIVDIAYAKAFIADKYNYCKPEIVQTPDGKSFVDVIDLRHCLIEKIQQSELYVANDIALGDGNLDGMLLYGTNAVGKTSFIRALGISVVMAQAGLYVPASCYKYKPYKCIFTRILGNDNLFKGLSTFAVEMSELRNILRMADKNSLVLGDELCSGTESTSAISIFVAGVKWLYERKVSFIFATHLHEIVNFQEIQDMKTVGLFHMSVIYDREKDMLIYDRKLKHGPGNNMYGLEVCKSLSLPQDFLNMANEIRMKYHPESQSLLDHAKSHYNAKHIKGMCQNCGKEMASEVHHLQHQKNANDKGIIKHHEGHIFHKNHPANLLSVCEKCHDELHASGKQHKVVKTSKGTVIRELPFPEPHAMKKIP